MRLSVFLLLAQPRRGCKRRRFPATAALCYDLRSASNAMAVNACELCSLARTTTWYGEYAEPFRFVLLDCDSCDVPMAVLGAHRAVPTAAERDAMQDALARVADAKYPRGWYFDDHMRQIPDHYHVHARPYPSWWRPRS